MKLSRFLILNTSLLLIIFGFVSPNEESLNNSGVIEKRVEELLKNMTLEEKVGQMTQITIATVSKTMGTVDQENEIDYEKLEEAITKYHVGSILNVFDVAITVDRWHEIIKSIQNIAVNKTRLGIPIIYGIDAVHGATYTLGSTIFPQAINMAATWNRELLEKEGEITSKQVRACGISWNFYPVLDIGRQPLWPRLWETYGEDVYLATQLGKSYIYGAQGDDIGEHDKLATCLKHWVGYSYPLNGRDRTPAWISENTLREYFLPTFEAGIKSGSPTVMVNSSELNGIPMHSNYHLLTEVLKNELKFDGFVVSDWEDIKRLFYRDRIATNPKEAVKIAVMAGVDMSMVPTDYSFYTYLLELVNDGEVPVSRIDDAVSRILSVKMKLGLFEEPMPIDNYTAEFNNDSYDSINYEAAVESIILTKNENNFLPLSGKNKILVTGPTANLLSSMNGGWTFTWQGNEERIYPESENTVLEAIEKSAGKENVKYFPGSTFNQLVDVDKLKDAAEGTNLIIACLGEPAYCEGNGNINDLTLDTAQLKLVDKLSQLGKPIILIMLEGRPRLINSIVDKAKSILIGFLPGLKGGDAIADIIFGKANPSGKLPLTYPKFPSGFMCYDFKPLEAFDIGGYNPQWEFGYGLSYSAYEYSDLKIDKTEFNSNENLVVTVNIKNTGNRKGKESVQLYVHDLFGSVSRPMKQLKGFDKIELIPGETKKVTFTIEPEQLSFIGRDGKRITEPGDFEIYIDSLKASFKLL